MKRYTSLLILLVAFATIMTAFGQTPGIDELVRTGVINYNNGNLKTSYDMFRQAMKMNPNHPEASRWFWKMKNEHDVTKLSDRGQALTGAEPLKDAQLAEKKQSSTDKTKITSATEPVRREYSREVPRRTVEKAVRVVYVDPGGRAIDRKMQNIDEKLSKLYQELKAAKEKEARADQTPGAAAIDWTSPYIIMLGFIAFIFVMIFFTALVFYRSRIRRIPPVPQPAADTTENIVKSVFDRLGFEVGQDKKMLALTMAKKMLGESPAKSSQLVGLITRLSLDRDESVSRESRRLLEGLGGPASEEGATATGLAAAGELPGTVESYTEGYLLLLDTKYKWDHSRKVKMLAGEVGMRLGLAKGEIKELMVASLLENSGFLRIPDAILNKKTQLTKDEMAQILLHPEYSADIALSMGVPEKIVEAVRCHHERYNGNGYPARKSGSSIPLYARIIGICDSYTALTSEKPFRAPMPVDGAVEMLRKESFLFDPEILKVFFEVIDFVRYSESSMKNELVITN